MTAKTFSLRRWSLLGLFGLALAGAGWWALWHLAADRYNARLDSWVAAGRAAGTLISWDDRRLFGFPRHIIMRIDNLRWQNTDGIVFQAANIDIGASPWQTRSFTVKFKGRAELAAPFDPAGRTLQLSGGSGSAQIKLDSAGVWRRAAVQLNDARFGRSPDGLFSADHLAATALRPATPPADHRATGLTVTAAGDRVTVPPSLPSGFGPVLNKLAVSLRVMGAVPDFRQRDAVDAWNKDSGVVEFDQLHLVWGPLLLAANGTVGFDDDLQPEGAFASVVGNADAVLQTLADSGFIAASQFAMLHEALGVFVKPASADGVTGIALPITVQLGGLFLGPVKVFSFPEINWPVEPVPTAIIPPPAAP